MVMEIIERITSENDFFYKKKDLPTLKVGDKVKVLNYLELLIGLGLIWIVL